MEPLRTVAIGCFATPDGSTHVSGPPRGIATRSARIGWFCLKIGAFGGGRFGCTTLSNTPGTFTADFVDLAGLEPLYGGTATADGGGWPALGGAHGIGAAGGGSTPKTAGPTGSFVEPTVSAGAARPAGGGAGRVGPGGRYHLDELGGPPTTLC